jgi:hypothetical protein
MFLGEQILGIKGKAVPKLTKINDQLIKCYETLSICL